jgi:excisionase family DNA binding protein
MMDFRKHDQMLTLQEAADMLNLSSSFLVELLESGVIPFTEVGTDRYIQYSDLLQYKNHLRRERRKMLAEIANISQEAGEY